MLVVPFALVVPRAYSTSLRCVLLSRWYCGTGSRLTSSLMNNAGKLSVDVTNDTLIDNIIGCGLPLSHRFVDSSQVLSIRSLNVRLLS